MIIDEIVNKIIELGLDLGTKDAVKSTLEALDADTNLLDEVYISLKNRLNLKSFAKTEYQERALFLPQCMRNSMKCIAELTEDGYVCKRCGSCSIPKILDVAEKLGYKCYIVPGGSMVFKLVKETVPKACVGVGCYYEVEEAIARLARVGIPTQGIPLTTTGCKDTTVDVDRVIKILQIH